MTIADDSTVLTTPVSAQDAIDALTWEESDRPDLIGLEVEAFPIVTHSGIPVARLPLHGPGGVSDVVGTRFASSPGADGEMSGPLSVPGGGQITFEPGGQIEYSSTPRFDTASLRVEVNQVWDTLQSEFLKTQVRLVCLGIDPWHDVRQVPQQLTAGRYVAMDRYFSSMWPSGAVMMRNTCSLQVNLESGSGTAREQRWLAANLISPILSAMFSTSPGRDGAASRRGMVWQEIDPTRVGMPTWSDINQVNPVQDTRARALGANVMFVVRDGHTTPLEVGWSFSEWVRYGHPSFGQPTIADLRTHLSTLFPEVRPRAGTLELRGIDSVPRRWWMVPAVISGAILSVDQARDQTIELLSPLASNLARVSWTAAHQGLGDPELAALSGKVGQLAFDAAIADGRFDRESIKDTERFLDRFTMRGLAPGDELRPLLASPRGALDWALAEPARKGDW